MATTIMHYTPATNVTGKAQAALTQGTLVMIAGEMDGRNPLVKPATADANVFGVAAHDCEAGGYVTIYREGMYELASTGSIAAGDPVSAGANGKAAKASAGPVVGIAVTKAAGNVVTVALK